MSASSFILGQKAQILTNKSIGTVRYNGNLHFIDGDWLGLELPDDSGKNDGEVQGKRYFTCPPNHGVFVRTANAKPITEPSPAVASLKNVTSRTSLAPSTTTSSAPAAKKPAPRLSMAPTTKRQSMATAPASRLLTKGPPSILKTIPAGSKGHVSPTRSGPHGLRSASAASSAVPTPSVELSAKATPSDSGSEPAAEEIAAARPVPRVEFTKPVARKLSGATSVASLNAQLEVLRRQTQSLEAESAKKDEQLRAATSEKDKYATIVQKLEAKIRPQSEEISQLRKQLQESAETLATLEHEKEEAEKITETLTMEKTFTMEKMEKIEKENEELSYKVEDLQLSKEILELELEKTAVDETIEGETDSKDVLHFKIENDRMREALVRLRDLTRNEKKEDEAKIKQLEQENAEIEQLKEDLAQTETKLTQAVETIELQKAQIDSVDMQETVVMDLQSKLDETQAALNGRTTELEYANTMIGLLKEEVAYYLEDINKWYDLTMLAVDDISKLKLTQADQDITIDKFRKWSSELQLNLSQLQGSQDISQQEKIELEKKNQQYKELAFKSQSSADRTHNTELQQSLIKGYAGVCEEQNEILKNYARRGFQDASLPVEALKIISSIKLKASGLHQYFKSKPDPLPDYNEDELCRPHCIVYLGRLKLVSSHIEAHLRTASVDIFLDFGEACQQLTEIENQFDHWINGVTNGELEERELKTTAIPTLKTLEHLLRMRFDDPYTTPVVVDSDLNLEYIVSALGSIKALLTLIKNLPEGQLPYGPGVEEKELVLYEDWQQDLYTNCRVLLNAEREANDALEQLKLLTKRGMHIDEVAMVNLRQAVEETDDILDRTLRNTERFWKIVSRERDGPLTFRDIQEPTDFIHTTSTKDFKWLDTRIGHLVSLINDPERLEEILEEDFGAPWVKHSLALDFKEAELQDAAQKLTATKAELAEKNTTIAINNKTIEELNVSVEVLNKRVNSSGAQSTKIIELERAAKTANEEKEALRARAEAIKLQLKQRIEEDKRRMALAANPPITHSTTTLAQSKSIDLVKRQNEALSATLRATVIKNQNTIGFENLDKPQTPIKTLEQRTAETLTNAFNARQEGKKENAKKKNLARKKREADLALRCYRKAMKI